MTLRLVFGGNQMNNGNITRLVLRAGMRAAAAGVALIAAVPALAVTTIDQTNYVTGSDRSGIDRYFQTFTAGLSGSLAEVVLQISKSSKATLSVEIYKARIRYGSTTVPYGDPIGTGTFVRDAFGLMTYSTNAFVQAGQYYAVKVSVIVPDPSEAVYWSFNAEQYDRGNSGFVDTPVVDFDFGFTTVVDRDVTPPSAVPEPATWGMMILGMGAVGFVMRRRRTITTRVSYVV